MTILMKVDGNICTCLLFCLANNLLHNIQNIKFSLNPSCKLKINYNLIFSRVSDEELGSKVGRAQEDEEGVEEDGWGGEGPRPLLARHVDQARQQEHHHQATGSSAV